MADVEQLHPVACLPEEWETVLARLGERSFRATQVFRWIHRRGELCPAEMTDLSLALRGRLTEAGLGEPGRVIEVRRSVDGTRKLIIELGDGARTECVLIPMSQDPKEPTVDADAGAAADEDDVEPAERRRVTLCVSTQYGCKLGCVFCASGQAGFRRGLNAAEIVYQLLAARRQLEPGEKLQNVVFMGMGEPLDNYQQSARAIRLLSHPDGADLSLRRITVSTVGLVPGIERLGRDFGGKVGLALSLHAPDDSLRDRIVPINRRYPIARLMQALRDYPLPKRRRLTIEYTLIAGLNDDLSQARALARLLRDLHVKLNLIAMNTISGSPLRGAEPGRVQAFREILASAGYSCFVRLRRGDDVSAACGQLAISGQKSASGGPGGA